LKKIEMKERNITSEPSSDWVSAIGGRQEERASEVAPLLLKQAGLFLCILH
jgi:hypothetical protein